MKSSRNLLIDCTLLLFIYSLCNVFISSFACLFYFLFIQFRLTRIRFVYKLKRRENNTNRILTKKLKTKFVYRSFVGFVRSRTCSFARLFFRVLVRSFVNVLLFVRLFIYLLNYFLLLLFPLFTRTTWLLVSLANFAVNWVTSQALISLGNYFRQVELLCYTTELFSFFLCWVKISDLMVR